MAQKKEAGAKSTGFFLQLIFSLLNGRYDQKTRLQKLTDSLISKNLDAVQYLLAIRLVTLYVSGA